MQKIEVVLSDDCFTSVTDALRKARVGPFRASGIQIFDPAAPLGIYRGAPYPTSRESMKLEWIVSDCDVGMTIEAIQNGLDALGEGDAEVVVQPVAKSMRLTPSVWTRRRAAR